MAGWGGGTSWRTVIRAEDIGFQTMFMEIYTLRERVMDVLEAISGNRVNYGMNCLGGVMRDIADADMILSAVHAIRHGLEQDVVPVFTGDRTVRARTAGVGVLSRENALAYGVVGPTARASGVAVDVRQDAPYPNKFGLRPPLFRPSGGYGPCPWWVPAELL
jgi:Ni,Fe-hydrogenase III large subunit